MKTSLLAALCLLAAGLTPLFAVDPPPGGGYPGNNTALGDDALLNLTTGTDNTALGFEALTSATAAGYNTAIGSQALARDTTGNSNVAIGPQALLSNKTGGDNVAISYLALHQNTSGNGNVAIGHAALGTNQGSENIAIGDSAVPSNLSGESNTAVGHQVMLRNRSGSRNCAYGEFALSQNEGGASNTAIGQGALFNALGSNNIGLGTLAGFAIQGSNNIDIGAQGKGDDNGQIRIGTRGVHDNVHIAGIYGTTVADGVPVVADKFGRLGTVSSSARFKQDIQPMKQASETILSLQPVTFHYRKDLDSLGTPQFGLIAEEVAKVDPALVVRDEAGKPYTVRYEAVNAMLLNEFLKEHREVEAQRREIDALRAELRNAVRQIEKVSLQVQQRQPGPRLASTNE